MHVATDHGWPKASDGTDAHAFDAFKNERDYIAQSGNLKTTVAAMDWATREIEQLRNVLKPFADLAAVGGTPGSAALKQVIHKILENAPYPDDLHAVNEFCSAILAARALLPNDDLRTKQQPRRAVDEKQNLSHSKTIQGETIR